MKFQVALGYVRPLTTSAGTHAHAVQDDTFHRRRAQECARSATSVTQALLVLECNISNGSTFFLGTEE